MNWQFFERLAEHRMTPTVRSVGLVLAIRAKRDDPTCNPSIRNLCKYASVGTHGAVGAIRKLQELELIEVKKEEGKNHVYTLRTVAPSTTVTVAETSTVGNDPKNGNSGGNRSTERNGQCETVLLSATVPFYRAQPKGKTCLEPFLVQDSDVMGVPY